MVNAGFSVLVNLKVAQPFLSSRKLENDIMIYKLNRVQCFHFTLSFIKELILNHCGEMSALYCCSTSMDQLKSFDFHYFLCNIRLIILLAAFTVCTHSVFYSYFIFIYTIYFYLLCILLSLNLNLFNVTFQCEKKQLLVIKYIFMIVIYIEINVMGKYELAIP